VLRQEISQALPASQAVYYLPAWYIKAPASTDDYVYIAGTGYSNDLAMSREKALLDAQLKLADKINGMMNAVIKQHKTDSDGTVGVDKTSVTVKKVIMDTALTGYHIEDSKIQTENRSYRTFMLLRYPIGDANRLLKVRQQREDQLRDSDDAAQKELEKDLETLRKPKAVKPRAESEPVSLAPVTDKRTAPATIDLARAVERVEQRVEPVAVVKPLDVSNVEYKARRDAALARGASIEQFTIR
jgi:hypothetical protein